LVRKKIVKESEALLIIRDISSLVIDTLYKQAMNENAAFAFFYSNSTAQGERSATAILGSVLKQIVDGLDEVPERIVKAFRDRGKVSGDQRPTLREIVEFLRDISSARRTFIIIDALDECAPGHRAELLDALNHILQNSPSARIFLTGRPHIRGEVDRHLAGRAAIIFVMPTREDVVKYLRAKLKEDTVPEAMGEGLEEEIAQNIPKTVADM